MTSAGGDLAYKTSCCSLYEQEAVRFLLGDCWRPGGLALTRQMLAQAGVRPGSRLLDVACGLADSASAAAGLDYRGIDLSPQSLRSAAAGSSARGRLVAADADALPFRDGSFDAVLLQCAFSTFPNPARAASEIARVLAAEGTLVLADVTVEAGTFPIEIDSLLARAACITDARPLAAYATEVAAAGLTVESIVDRPDSAADFLSGIDRKLLMVRIGQAVGKLDLGGVDVAAARRLLRRGLELVESGQLSYGYLIAAKP